MAPRAVLMAVGAVMVVGTIFASEIAPDASPLRSFGIVVAAVLTFLAVVAVVCQPFFRSVSGNVYARADVLPPTSFLLAPIAGLTLSGIAVVRRFGITLGFALALVAVLVVVRVLTLLSGITTRVNAFGCCSMLMVAASRRGDSSHIGVGVDPACRPLDRPRLAPTAPARRHRHHDRRGRDARTARFSSRRCCSRQALWRCGWRRYA